MPHTGGGPPPTHPERYKWIALSNTTLGILMAVINQSIVIIALPAIFRGIHLNPLIPSNTSYLLWMLLGFMVVMAVLVVSLGRVGDIFGRVRMYNLGFAVFTLGSILLSVTWLQGSAGAMWMIVMRVVQGIGAAFLMANSSAILTDAFPAEERGSRLGSTWSRRSPDRSSDLCSGACSHPWRGGWCSWYRCRSGCSAPCGPT